MSQTEYTAAGVAFQRGEAEPISQDILPYSVTLDRPARIASVMARDVHSPRTAVGICVELPSGALVCERLGYDKAYVRGDFPAGSVVYSWVYTVAWGTYNAGAIPAVGTKGVMTVTWS